MASTRILLAFFSLLSASACTWDLSKRYDEYLEQNKGEFQFPATGYDAQYYIAPHVRDYTIHFDKSNFTTAMKLTANFGSMLEDTLESTDYRTAFNSLTETSKSITDNGILFKYVDVDYGFTNDQTQIVLHIIITRDGQPILSKKYKKYGRPQSGKLFWVGRWALFNAIHQSTKSALDRLLADSLADFHVALTKPIGISKAAPGPSLDDLLSDLRKQYDDGDLNNEEYMQQQRKLVSEHTKRIREDLNEAEEPTEWDSHVPFYKDSRQSNFPPPQTQ